MSPQLQQLIALQEVDLKINELTDRLAVIPIERERVLQEFNESAADYNAFLRAVQNDQAQGFTLDLAAPATPTEVRH